MQKENGRNHQLVAAEKISADLREEQFADYAEGKQE